MKNAAFVQGIIPELTTPIAEDEELNEGGLLLLQLLTWVILGAAKLSSYARKKRTVVLFFFLLTLCASVPVLSAQAVVAKDSTQARPLYPHNPYDFSQHAERDSSDVFASRQNWLFALPSYFWAAMVYPLGELTIYAEQARVWTKYFKIFTNADGTFGVFPQLQMGGETGFGSGARMFHTNFAGKGKKLDGYYIYSGGQGQTGAGQYQDPNLLGSGLEWTLEGEYLQTRNRSANINAAVRTDPSRLFQVTQIDAEMSLGWRLETGPLASFQQNLSINAWTGYARRDFRVWLGGIGRLSDLGSTYRSHAAQSGISYWPCCVIADSDDHGNEFVGDVDF